MVKFHRKHHQSLYILIYGNGRIANNALIEINGTSQ
jgi:hypothetical protein